MSDVIEYFERKVFYLEELLSNIDGVTSHMGSPFYGVSFEFTGTHSEVESLLAGLAINPRPVNSITELDYFENSSIRWLVKVKLRHPNKREDLLDW